jgi:hypothetical protein
MRGLVHLALAMRRRALESPGMSKLCRHSLISWLLSALIGVTLVGVASCGRATLSDDTDAMVSGDAQAPSDTGVVGGDAQGSSDANGPCFWTAFDPPERVFGVAVDDDWLGSVSAEGTALIFDRFEDTLNNLYIATRASVDQPFGDAVPISELNTAAREYGGTLMPGGLELYFVSDRDPTPFTGLWRATRATPDGLFDVVAPVAELHVGGDVLDASVTPDGLAVYFSSARAGGRDLWFAERLARDVPFSEPQPLSEINTGSPEQSPGISADRLELFFVSDRLGGAGELDVWRATRVRVDQPFGRAENVGELNTGNDDVSPSLSADGSILYFNRDTETNGGLDADVWEARRQCVVP